MENAWNLCILRLVINLASSEIVHGDLKEKRGQRAEAKPVSDQKFGICSKVQVPGLSWAWRGSEDLQGSV